MKKGFFGSLLEALTPTTNEVITKEIEKTSVDEIFSCYRIANFLFSQRKGPIKLNDKYPKYFIHELRITNPKAFHETMIDDGYLKPSEIKKGIQHYSLTEKGEAYINEYDYCVKLHQHKEYCIELKEYVQAMNAHPKHLKFNDIVWSILNTRVEKAHIDFDFYGYRINLWHMSSLLYSEKQLKDSLYYALLVQYLDVSGFHEPSFATAVVERIVELKEYYSNEIIDKVYKRVHYDKLNKHTFKKLICTMMDDCVFDEEKLLKIVKRK